MKSFLDQLQWRHAAKAFDPSKKVSDAHLKRILEAIRMAPSSFGLQPFRVTIVTKLETKQKIQAAAWNQPQVSQASHLLVFSTIGDLAGRARAYARESLKVDPSRKDALEKYVQMIEGFISKFSPADQRHWAHKQAYIALGFAHAAAAELEVESCPFEGFDPSAVDTILQFSPEEKSCVMFGIGGRDSKVSARPKVRFPESELFRFLD